MANQMSNTVIIDGTNLSIIHFTANPAVDENGIPIGMVKGFLNSLLWIKRTLKPTKILIFFDTKGGSIQRRELYSEYKEGRKPKEIVGRYYKFSNSDMAEKNKEYQFSLLKQILEMLPVNVINCRGFESDDGIAYCVNHKDFFKFGNCFIVSCDKDFYQLISKEVSIYNPMSKKIINEKSVIDEFGIHPHNWLFYRSISGDKSDNVEGVKGFGPKTLLKIFSLESHEYKYDVDDIDAMFESVASFENESTKKRIVSLYENKKTIERNWKLLSLHEPMISALDKDKITQHIESFKPRFKQLDIYKTVGKLGLNVVLFDEFAILR